MLTGTAASGCTGTASFPVFSISKSLTSVLMLQRVERGEVRLDTPVCEVLPAFGTKGKQRATIGQLLCHCAGLPASFSPPVAPEQQGNLDVVVPAICDVGINTVPGEEVSYAPIMAHCGHRAVRAHPGGRPSALPRSGAAGLAGATGDA